MRGPVLRFIKSLFPEIELIKSTARIVVGSFFWRDLIFDILRKMTKRAAMNNKATKGKVKDSYLFAESRDAHFAC